MANRINEYLRWIKFAYNEKNKNVQRRDTQRAVNPTCALYKDVSVKINMNETDCTKESTFTRFYLREPWLHFLH